MSPTADEASSSIPPNASKYPATGIIVDGACGLAAEPPRDAPAAVSGWVASDGARVDAGGASDAGIGDDSDDDGVAAPAAGDCPGSVGLLPGAWLPESMTTGDVALGTGSPGTGPVGAGEGGVAVGDWPGVVGAGNKGLSGTQNPPPATGTWPGGQGSAAAVAGNASMLMTTADHTARMPKTIRPVSTSYYATRQQPETVGHSPLSCGHWCLTCGRKRGRQYKAAHSSLRKGLP
jgi:hypothetical protein